MWAVAQRRRGQQPQGADMDRKSGGSPQRSSPWRISQGSLMVCGVTKRPLPQRRIFLPKRRPSGPPLGSPPDHLPLLLSNFSHIWGRALFLWTFLARLMAALFGPGPQQALGCGPWFAASLHLRTRCPVGALLVSPWKYACSLFPGAPRCYVAYLIDAEYSEP